MCRDGSGFQTHVVLESIRDRSATLLGYWMVLMKVRAPKPAGLEAPATSSPSRDASHELRNRLAVIANAVYYLKLVLPEDGETREYLEILTREVREVSRILTAGARPGPRAGDGQGRRRPPARPR